VVVEGRMNFVAGAGEGAREEGLFCRCRNAGVGTKKKNLRESRIYSTSNGGEKGGFQNAMQNFRQRDTDESGKKERGKQEEKEPCCLML